jgi:hypothetical protein
LPCRISFSISSLLFASSFHYLFLFQAFAAALLYFFAITLSAFSAIAAAIAGFAEGLRRFQRIARFADFSPLSFRHADTIISLIFISLIDIFADYYYAHYAILMIFFFISAHYFFDIADIADSQLSPLAMIVSLRHWLSDDYCCHCCHFIFTLLFRHYFRLPPAAIFILPHFLRFLSFILRHYFQLSPASYFRCHRFSSFSPFSLFSSFHITTLIIDTIITLIDAAVITTPLRHYAFDSLISPLR